MAMDASRLSTAIRGELKEHDVASAVIQAMQAVQDGSGHELMEILVKAVFDAVAPAVAAKVISEITGHAVVTVPVEATDAGLQSYVAPPAGPAPTTAPLAPTSLDGSIA